MTEKEGPLVSASGPELSQQTYYNISNPTDCAVEYAHRGWKVFPLFEPQGSGCSCGAADCAKAGKHPRIPKWQEASCEPAMVSGWWKQWPDANIGLRLDGLTVLDVDGPEGEASLAELEQAHGPLVARVQQRSGGGGWHYLFAGVPGVERRIKFRPGLDLLVGSESYIVCEPSLHASV
jgi:putative DNA primase/helicase